MREVQFLYAGFYLSIIPGLICLSSRYRVMRLGDFEMLKFAVEVVTFCSQNRYKMFQNCRVFNIIISEVKRFDFGAKMVFSQTEKKGLDLRVS